MSELSSPLHSMVFRNGDLPVLYHRTDAIAVARQREAVAATRYQLLLLVAGAALASLPTSLKVGGSFQVAAFFSVLAYVGVLVLGYLSTRRRAKSHWQLNRSAAEFIKSMCWRYAVHGAPFDSHVSERGADDLFSTRLEEGLRELVKVGWEDPRTADGETAAGDLITTPMRRLRAKPFSVRKETYVRDRLIEQRNWYHRRTEMSRRATALWSASIAMLTLFALFFATLRTFSVADSFHAPGVLSAAAAACLAWSEIRRHQPLIAAHSLVEEDLAAMHTAMETTVTDAQWPSAVYETERIVSPQHTDWLVRHRS
ncbi:membrane protein [Streptomyces pristinaespiralis]|nr:membrane protein [Streptomyces pristinaespiralis]